MIIMDVGNVIAAGMNLAGTIVGSSGDKPRYVASPSTNFFRYGDDSPFSSGAFGGKGITQMPESVYWSQMMNRYNQQAAQAMLQKEADINRETYMNYMSPQAMRQQYIDAGLNPALVMSGGVSNGVASSSQQSPSGSVDTSSLTNAANERIASRNNVISVIGQSMDFLNSSLNRQQQQSLVNSQSRSYSAEAEGKEIDNTTLNIRNLAALGQLRESTKNEELKNAIDAISLEILNDTKQNQKDKIAADATQSQQGVAIKDLESDILRYDKQRHFWEQAIAQKNYEWLDSEKAASISEIYSRCALNHASAEQFGALVRYYNEQTRGSKLNNDNIEALTKDYRRGMANQYASMDIQRNILLEKLKQAKKDNNTYMIRFLNEQLESLSRSYYNVASGTSSLLRGSTSLVPLM